MFDLAIDSKLRGCDVVKIKIGDIVVGGRIRNRAIVVRQKTTVRDYEKGRRVPIPATLAAMKAALEARGIGFVEGETALAITHPKAENG